MGEALSGSVIVRLMRAIELRKMVQLLRDPDQVVDHVLAQYSGDQVVALTADYDLARSWAERLSPGLHIVHRIQRGIHFGVVAELNGQPYHCSMLARAAAIPACLVGLNAFIDLTNATLDSPKKSG